MGAFVRWCCVLLSLLMGAARSQAATINAASCSPADVQAAHTAASAGDTIQLPTCTYTNWNTTVTITKHNLTIKGNGAANTIIQRAQVAASYENNEMFQVDNTTGMVFQDFALDGTQDTNLGTWDDFGIHLNNCVDFRVHHMTISHLAIGIQVHGDPTVQRGVIDHNTFTNNRMAGGLGYAVSVVGNGTYPALALGTAQNVFIEDNTVDGGKTLATLNNGARAVVRYNTGGNPQDNDATVNTHGLTSFPRGTRQIEVYNNTFSGQPRGGWMGIGISGGDGVIFNNTVNNYDGSEYNMSNSNCSGTYPLQDQIRDLWFWNNTVNGAALTSANVGNECSAYIQLNRDYFFGVKSGYTAYTYPHPATLASTPPTATITTDCGAGAGNNCTVAAQTFTTLAGTAADDVGVTSVTWSCPTCSPTTGTATCATCGASATAPSWSVASLALASGANVLTVTAHDADTQTGTDTLTVTYTPLAAAPAILRLVK